MTVKKKLNKFLKSFDSFLKKKHIYIYIYNFFFLQKKMILFLKEKKKIKKLTKKTHPTWRAPYISHKQAFPSGLTQLGSLIGQRPVQPGPVGPCVK